jgi:hypothetical protein
LRAKGPKRRNRTSGPEPTIPGDQAVLRRIAVAHLRLNLLSLLWEDFEGEDFAVLWAATVSAARQTPQVLGAER